MLKTKFFTISKNDPSYIIGEIGSNHNGNFDMAIELISKAKEAGVNAVKFQTFKAKTHYSKKTNKISLYKENIYDLIESLEIDRRWHIKLSKACNDLELDFMDSPCDSDAIKLTQEVGMDLIKVSSFDMVDSRLLEQIAKTGKSIVFSTGMSNMAEIENAVNIVRRNKNNNIAILQCTSLYPAPFNLANLSAMETIKNAFNVIVGYSDHTIGDHIACAAVARGAKIIEKHITLDKSLPGPDHSFAINMEELKTMVSRIREIESSLGDGIKNGPREEELEFFKNARRSLIAKKNIKKGEMITSDHIIIKRPNYGIHPFNIQIVIGRISKENIKKDDPILWENI